MSDTRILLLGGHGKVSLLITPKLVSRSWHVISVIRSKDQIGDVLEAGQNGPGKIETLVANLEEIKTENDAQKILDLTKPTWVIWSAGAGGKGGPERTIAIDRDACICFIRRSIATPTITKFLLISALSSRRSRAPWIGDECYALIQKINNEVMPTYYHAKLAADETLTVLGKERDGFDYISLRPGRLTDEPETGKVSLGKTRVKGGVSRADVAEVGAQLLDHDNARGWFDVIDGNVNIKRAVEEAVRGGIDSIEGEDINVMKQIVRG
ncbi:putative nad dependent epimerase dehydratase family protein [Erysiphe necator]|uniref:Putative nad dependent epimerase dehydratase family protein n=1 Tax=Uncinula necator TaxID=52586 RepID=A0A0B1PFX5_UNCNE|nr:putative nad dependent epimerase dehydratase family protein [Erysiphe necator]